MRMKSGWWKTLYVQVLVAIAAGVLLGWLDPKLGEQMEPLGKAFINLVKMIIAPVIFVFFLAQKAFIEGVTLTGVKG